MATVTLELVAPGPPATKVFRRLAAATRKGICARVSTKLGLSESLVRSVAEGKKQSQRVCSALIDECERIRVELDGPIHTERHWNGDHLESVKTTFRRVEGKTISSLTVHEDDEMGDRDSQIQIEIKFTDGDSWWATFEAPKFADASYSDNSDIVNSTRDEYEFPGINARRRAIRHENGGRCS